MAHTQIANALHYTERSSGVSIDMARGLVIGMVVMLMAERDIQFGPAFKIFQEWLPLDYRREAIPEPWRDLLSRP